MPSKEIIETGKTVDAAIDSACEKLGCGRDECEWEIIDLPRKGFLGLKNIPARVKVSFKPVEQEIEEKNVKVQKTVIQRDYNIKPATSQVKRDPPRAPEKNVISAAKKEDSIEGIQGEAKVNLAREYIESILDKMGLEAEISVLKEEKGVCINIEGKGLGSIIGRRGETLDAIQYLASLVANRAEGEYVRITIDCGDYRTKRKETLETLARRLAAQVLKTNVSRTLEPMNPFERRIIHATVSEIEGVTSISTGDEPNRRVVITSPLAKSRSGARNRDYQKRERPYSPHVRENIESSSLDAGERDAKRTRKDPRGYEDRRPPRRDSRRDSREAKQAVSTKSEGPPKQTPEAVSTNKPLYTKIDL